MYRSEKDVKKRKEWWRNKKDGTLWIRRHTHHVRKNLSTFRSLREIGEDADDKTAKRLKKRYDASGSWT